MTPKEKAIEIYKDCYSRWCFEPSHDKNVLTAKSIGLYVCKHVLSHMGADRGVEFWEQVKHELENLEHSEIYSL